MLVDMDITRSHSRPHTSNDNPFSEAQFKTMKYVSDYPDRFASVNEARTWMEGFITYYNHEHRHSGIGYHTPASVHYGTAAVREQRQATLDRAHNAHPERFARRPITPPLPLKAAINDPAKRPEPSVH
ncbi:integrase core domain-containing protein [Arthrobacter sp. A5]|uniref:integrase core domain-containing protein n=1 Tax=Arthrobacter sp. A5 TaxID=576926 RepID=UPI003DA96F30